MRCAMMERILLRGTSSPGCGTGAAGAAGFGAAGADEPAGGAETGAGFAGAGFSRCASTSSLVMRPPAPVPETCARSRLFSLAILRTSGEERACSPDAATGSDTGVGAGAAGLAAAGVGVGAAAGAAAPAVPPITATTVLIWTVVPASALISVNTPAAGDGISASTLSVEISKSGSSRSTLSPTCLSHLVMVPSKIDSPICGITISVAGPEAAEADAAAGADSGGAPFGVPSAAETALCASPVASATV